MRDRPFGPRSGRRRWVVVWLSCALGIALGAAPAGADGQKGRWGRVTPIAPDRHPNLYYDQSEIDELRSMILVRHSPEQLDTLYRRFFRDVTAVPTIPVHDRPHPRNMKAAISYMIEPSTAKADAIRESLLSFLRAFPDGLPTWYKSRGCYFCGYSVPWLFDLVLAYHPETLSRGEVVRLRAWFAKSAQRAKFDTRVPYRDNERKLVAPVTREGKTMMPYPNWFSRYMGPSLACALVSGDQEAVDYWADSGWPHDLLVTDGIERAGLSGSVNRYDLVMYLLAVYPSGANTDTYAREGFQVDQRDWNTTTYHTRPADGGHYHFAQMAGAILGAEMAYHNGMTGVFGITDAGAEPALLRTFKRAIRSRSEPDRRPTSRTGHPDIGYDPIIWAGYRRYADRMIEDATATLTDDHGFGPELPNEVWRVLGFPRRIVWPPTGQAPPPAGVCVEGCSR
jgi:hypothetical protein